MLHSTTRLVRVAIAVSAIALMFASPTIQAQKTDAPAPNYDLAAQWTSRKGIRVNAVAPGFFASEMTEQYPDGYLDMMMVRVPAGRVGEHHELVTALIFLASDASSYVTGIVLPVDGGVLTT